MEPPGNQQHQSGGQSTQTPPPTSAAGSSSTSSAQNENPSQSAQQSGQQGAPTRSESDGDVVFYAEEPRAGMYGLWLRYFKRVSLISHNQSDATT